MARKTLFEELTGTVNEILNQVRKLIREGSARRLLIRNKKGKTLLEVPLTAGVAGTAMVTAMAPVVSAISMFALFLNDVTILVERYPESEEEEEERMKNETKGRKQKNSDEYEVEAEFIEIEDEEEEEEQRGEKTVGSNDEKKSDREEPFPADDEQPEKTVGKDDGKNKN